jgi:hypothetical protein
VKLKRIHDCRSRERSPESKNSSSNFRMTVAGVTTREMGSAYYVF